MSHIAGHIDGGTGSCGILHIDEPGYENKDMALFFAPSEFVFKKGDKVKFLPLEVPLTKDGDTILIAYNILPRGNDNIEQEEIEKQFESSNEYLKFYADDEGNELPLHERLKKIGKKTHSKKELEDRRASSHVPVPVELTKR